MSKPSRKKPTQEQPEKLVGKAYEKALKHLHVELVKLQEWVVAKGLKVCIVFEGRDGAGKGIDEVGGGLPYLECLVHGSGLTVFVIMVKRFW